MSWRRGEVLELRDVADALGLDNSRFVIESTVSGGMGTCLKLAHGGSRKTYALKVIRRDSLTTNDSYHRFLREIKLWVTASACDGVVEALTVTRINELPAVCAEWMRGGNLRDGLRKKDAALFYSTLDRILGALEWVYENHKIIHRDLKPENILLDESGKAFVSDWGLGKVQRDQMSRGGVDFNSLKARASNLTGTGTFIGTITYSAPEQILGKESVDYRADMYSLGCLMYEWESGSPPFWGETIYEIGYQHLEAPAPRLGGLFKRTGFGAETVIAKCLAKNPDDRFRNYSELRAALIRAGQSRGVSLKKYLPQRRYAIPLIGAQEIKEGFRGAIQGRPLSRERLEVDGATISQYAAVPLSTIEPFLKEADVLTQLGEWQRAADIYAPLFVSEAVEAAPDNPLLAGIAINYAICLVNLSKARQAVAVLDTLSAAKAKEAIYFVNLSLALLHCQDMVQAESVAKQGLASFPDDTDLLGNLSIALNAQRKYDEARSVAHLCLSLSRNVHSIEQVANIEAGMGRLSENIDWPRACTHYGKSLGFLKEATHENPRYLPARINLARTFIDLENYALAKDELSEI